MRELIFDFKGLGTRGFWMENTILPLGIALLQQGRLYGDYRRYAAPRLQVT